MNLECAHVNVRHEVIPIFVIMDKDAQIPKPDVLQTSGLHFLVSFHHFFCIGSPEVLHLMFRKKGQDDKGDRWINR